MEKDIKALKQYLIDFLLYLNDRQLINDYDFEYEKVAIKFIKKNKNKMSSDFSDSSEQALKETEPVFDTDKLNKQKDILEMAREYADTIEGHPCAHRSGLIQGFVAGYHNASKPSKVPYKCPVCNGSGLVPEQFYHYSSQEVTMTGFTSCRSCKATGIIIL